MWSGLEWSGVVWSGTEMHLIASFDYLSKCIRIPLIPNLSLDNFEWDKIRKVAS